MGQAQINVRTQACSGTFIARTKQAALTHNVRGKRLKLQTAANFIMPQIKKFHQCSVLFLLLYSSFKYLKVFLAFSYLVHIAV